MCQNRLLRSFLLNGWDWPKILSTEAPFGDLEEDALGLSTLPSPLSCYCRHPREYTHIYIHIFLLGSTFFAAEEGNHLPSSDWKQYVCRLQAPPPPCFIDEKSESKKKWRCSRLRKIVSPRIINVWQMTHSFGRMHLRGKRTLFTIEEFPPGMKFGDSRGREKFTLVQKWTLFVARSASGDEYASSTEGAAGGDADRRGMVDKRFILFKIIWVTLHHFSSYLRRFHQKHQNSLKFGFEKMKTGLKRNNFSEMALFPYFVTKVTLLLSHIFPKSSYGAT